MPGVFLASVVLCSCSCTQRKQLGSKRSKQSAVIMKMYLGNDGIVSAIIDATMHVRHATRRDMIN